MSFNSELKLELKRLTEITDALHMFLEDRLKRAHLDFSGVILYNRQEMESFGQFYTDFRKMAVAEIERMFNEEYEELACKVAESALTVAQVRKYLSKLERELDSFYDFEHDLLVIAVKDMEGK